MKKLRNTDSPVICIPSERETLVILLINSKIFLIHPSLMISFIRQTSFGCVYSFAKFLVAVVEKER